MRPPKARLLDAGGGSRYGAPSPAMLAVSLALLLRHVLLVRTGAWFTPGPVRDGLATPFLLGVWVLATIVWGVLRVRRLVSDAPRAALETAAYGLSAALFARPVATALPPRLVTIGQEGRIPGPSASSLTTLAEATTALGLFAFGLGLGLACAVGTIEARRVWRGEGLLLPGD